MALTHQRTLLAAAMTESQLLDNIRAQARLRGWATYHTLRSRGSEPGWPDLVLSRGERIMFRELKTERGTVTEAQHDWLQRLAHAGLDAGVWRPHDLLNGTIETDLRHGGKVIT